MDKYTTIKKYLLATIVSLLTFLPLTMIYKGICYIIYREKECMCLMQWDMPCDCFMRKLAFVWCGFYQYMCFAGGIKIQRF